MSTYKQLIYAKPPSPSIDPSLSSGTFSLKTQPLPSPQDVPQDSLLIHIHYLSLDPAMRGWLSTQRSYIAPVERGTVMRGQAIAQVVHAGVELRGQFAAGDWVSAYPGWQEYAVVKGSEAQRLTLPPGAALTDAFSVLGMTSLTAYFGLLQVGELRAGDTVVVSGAAGATGMMAGQIARIKGAKKVVGLAGSKEKCELLVKELGFDAAINYKEPGWRKQLSKATPEYIDVFFDNVGGEILDACLARAARNARFVICGAISQYNNTARPQGPASFLTVISQRVTIKGFIVFDYRKQYPAALKNLATWLAEGKLKRKETILKGGLEATPGGLVDLFAGRNIGKMIVEVAPMSKAGQADMDPKL